MKRNIQKEILMGMIFLSSGLHYNVVQAYSLRQFFVWNLTERRPSSIEESLNNLGKGKVYRRQPSQRAFINWVHEKNPDWMKRKLSEAVYNKKSGTALQILFLNSICHHLDNQNDLNHLPHIAIQNDDFLTLAALASAKYRGESGTQIPLFDINHVRNGLTPIMLATQFNCSEIFDFLEKAGADLFKKSDNGTVLHFALQAGSSDLAMKIIQKINDQYVQNNNQLQNGGQPQKRKQFLNEVNAHGETIFHIACKKFSQGELSPALFLAILFWVDDYDFRNSTQQRQIFEDIQEIIKKLKYDEKWYNLRKNFKIDEKTLKDIIQAAQKMLSRMCNVI
ncbi:MAG: ankyrin repeat domain-containing protein [Puniceicoccales bacterium]|jgi:hypothetical protein|nr:ankyrin repeat domain-containing protein [Puniceicoccales bacterium]